MLQGAGDGDGDVECLIDRQRSNSAKPIGQRFAVDEGHDEVRHAVDFADGQDRQYVLMVDGRQRSRFGIEALAHRAAGFSEILTEQLDRDGAADRLVAGEVDATHRAATDLALD